MSDDLPTARDHVTPGEFQALIADVKAGRTLPVEAEQLEASRTDPEAFKLRKRADAPPIGTEAEALAVFRLAARALKAAEQAYRDAQQAYGEAVKALSDEAVR